METAENKLTDIKPGRNSRCPCGSGKKYRKCCLNKKIVKSRSVDDVENHVNHPLGMLEGFLPKLNELKKQYVEEGLVRNDIGEVSTDEMEDIILAYANDFLANNYPKEDKKGLFLFCILSWNLSLLGPSDYEKGLKVIFKSVKIKKRSEDYFDLRNIFNLFMMKKNMEYPFVNKFIMKYDLIETGDDVKLNILELADEPD